MEEGGRVREGGGGGSEVRCVFLLFVHLFVLVLLLFSFQHGCFN